MNLQPLGTSHTIHPTVCVTHEPTTVRYKSHNPFNCLCHPWTYNRQIQVTQSIQLSVSLMNLQRSDTSHTIHPTVCVTHEPTTVRYKSHNPSNCLCHSWTYNGQIQVTQSIQLSVSLMNLQPSDTSHTIHPTVCVTHEPTTVRYKSHNPSNCLCHSWTYNRQVQVTQSIQLPVSLMNLQPLGTSHTIHPTVCVTHEPTTVRYKSHNPSNCLCHSWTYNRQIQVTQSIQLSVSLMNLQPSGTSHTIHPTVCVTHEPTTIRYKSHNPSNCLCHSWTYNGQIQVTQSIQLSVSLMNLQPSDTSHTIHPTVCVTREPTTVRYKSHNPSNCLCHSWTYNRQVQVTQSIQLSVSLMNLQPLGTSHTIHPTVCVTHEPTTIRYKSHNSIQLSVSLMNLQPLGTSHTIHPTVCVTHEPTTVRYKSHNPSNCLCHSWTYNRQVQVTQLHPTVFVTHEPTTFRYKSHNSIQLSVSLMNLQPSGTSHTTLSNCLCHSWNYNHQVQVIQLHPTVCVTHEPTTVRYKSHNPSRCICQSWTYNHQVQVV